MEKLFSASIILTFFFAYFIISSARKGQASDIKIKYQEDGSVQYVFPDGTKKDISMEGKTPYGEEITQKSKRLKRKSFIIDIIYSKMYSDDNMNKYTKRFYNTLISEVKKALNSKKLPGNNMKVYLSNCKFCKTGYCKRTNKKGLTIISYIGDKKSNEFTIDFSEILSKSKYNKTAEKVVEKIFN